MWCVDAVGTSAAAGVRAVWMVCGVRCMGWIDETNRPAPVGGAGRSMVSLVSRGVSERGFDFELFVCHYVVADLDVVVIDEADSSFVVHGYFLDIVLEAFQRVYVACVDYYAVAHEACLVCPLDFSLFDHTAGYGADF